MKKLLSIVLLSLTFLPVCAQNQFMLSQPYKKNWFFSTQMRLNLAIADNITDHPISETLQHGIGAGFDISGGKYLTKSIALRLGMGYSNVKNRADDEYVTEAEEFVQNFKGDGFYHFSLFEVYSDAIFDFTAMSSYYKADSRRFHILGRVGLGLQKTGDKKFYPRAGVSQELHDKVVNILTPEKYNTFLACRLGLILDYRFNPYWSGNFGINTSITTDKFDGIDFDEPFDILLRAYLGITYYFQ